MDLSVLGKEPIGPDEPAGIDVRYDPLFNELQAEVDQASAPSSAGVVDWGKVVNVASDILCHKSKDLLVASYLSVGLVHTRGIDGLALGLKIYSDLIEHHKADLFPERERARLRSVEWWLERGEVALKQLPTTDIHPDQRLVMEDHVAKLGQLLAELLPTEAPSLRVLEAFLTSTVRLPQVEEDELQNDGQSLNEPAHPPQSSVAEPLLAPAAQIETAVGVDDLLQQMRQTAATLRGQDPADPVAYRLLRQASWLTVGELPPADEGRTRLPAPTDSLRSRLLQLQRGQDRRALLEELEAQLSQFIFWLDLNRMVAEALAEVEGARPAISAVIQETVSMVERLPGVTELAFADGTPFAGEATKHWLKVHLDDGHKKGAPGMKSSPEFVPDADSSWREPPELEDGEEGRKVLGEAATFVKQGDLFQALEMFQDRLRRSRSGRECLQWQLAASRVFLGAGLTNLALPFLEQAVTDIEKHCLERYDPCLALAGFKLAWHGFRSQDDLYFKDKARVALQGIGRIDLVEMVRLT